MKIKAALFDLDDTLLQNNMEQFIPRYFGLLAHYAAPHFENRDRFLSELLRGTQAMIANTDRQMTNREVFWDTFASRTGRDAPELESFFAGFYERVFPQLEAVTERRPVAVEMVRYCFEQGMKVVIATNPLFPRRAVEHRLAWAGLPVSDYDFELVTTYEIMHAAKPQREYYEEILSHVDVPREQALMVGDDWENDIVPAAEIGLRNYWVTASDMSPPREDVVDAYGTLDDCFCWLRNVQET